MNTASIRLQKKAIALAVISALSPVISYGAAAKVEFAIGRVSVVGTDGRERPIAKGTEINQGDMVQTEDGRAQLRFNDGGYISLQPNTQFRVDEYNYDGKTDGGEKGFFSLLKGGLRAITGAVGHVNKENYRVNTPVATIGIRGTEFLAQYDGVLRVKVGNGAVYMSNSTGNLVLFSGQSGEVSDENSQPEYSNEEPSVTAAGPQGNTPGEVEKQNQQEQQQSDTFKVAEQYTESGTSCVVVGNCPVIETAGPTAFKTLTNQGVAIAHYDDEPGDELFGELKGAVPATIEFDSAGRITRILGPDGSFSVSNITGTFLDGGSDGALTWTRLNGGTVLASDEEGTNTANITNAHFIYGTSTSASDIAALHAQCASATYDLIGGTRPTDALGNVGMLHSGSFLSVNFGTPDVFAHLSGNMSAGPASGSFSASGYGSITGNGQFMVSNGSGSGCCGNCMAGVGFFAGPNAAQAGMSYAIDTGTSAGAITGTAAFKKGLPPS